MSVFEETEPAVCAFVEHAEGGELSSSRIGGRKAHATLHITQLAHDCPMAKGALALIGRACLPSARTISAEPLGIRAS